MRITRSGTHSEKLEAVPDATGLKTEEFPAAPTHLVDDADSLVRDLEQVLSRQTVMGSPDSLSVHEIATKMETLFQALNAVNSTVSAMKLRFLLFVCETDKDVEIHKQLTAAKAAWSRVRKEVADKARQVTPLWQELIARHASMAGSSNNQSAPSTETSVDETPVAVGGQLQGTMNAAFAGGSVMGAIPCPANLIVTTVVAPSFENTSAPRGAGSFSGPLPPSKDKLKKTTKQPVDAGSALPTTASNDELTTTCDQDDAAVLIQQQGHTKPSDARAYDGAAATVPELAGPSRNPSGAATSVIPTSSRMTSSIGTETVQPHSDDMAHQLATMPQKDVEAPGYDDQGANHAASVMAMSDSMPEMYASTQAFGAIPGTELVLANASQGTGMEGAVSDTASVLAAIVPAADQNIHATEVNIQGAGGTYAPVNKSNVGGTSATNNRPDVAPFVAQEATLSRRATDQAAPQAASRITAPSDLEPPGSDYPPMLLEEAFAVGLPTKKSLDVTYIPCGKLDPHAEYKDTNFDGVKQIVGGEMNDMFCVVLHYRRGRRKVVMGCYPTADDAIRDRDRVRICTQNDPLLNKPGEWSSCQQLYISAEHIPEDLLQDLPGVNIGLHIDSYSKRVKDIQKMLANPTSTMQPARQEGGSSSLSAADDNQAVAPLKATMIPQETPAISDPAGLQLATASGPSDRAPPAGHVQDKTLVTLLVKDGSENEAVVQSEPVKAPQEPTTTLADHDVHQALSLAQQMPACNMERDSQEEALNRVQVPGTAVNDQPGVTACKETAVPNQRKEVEEQLAQAGNGPTMAGQQTVTGGVVLPAALPAGLLPVSYSVHRDIARLPGLGERTDLNSPKAAAVACGAAAAVHANPMPQHAIIPGVHKDMPYTSFPPASRQTLSTVQSVLKASGVGTAALCQNIPSSSNPGDKPCKTNAGLMELEVEDSEEQDHLDGVGNGQRITAQQALTGGGVPPAMLPPISRKGTWLPGLGNGRDYHMPINPATANAAADAADAMTGMPMQQGLHPPMHDIPHPTLARHQLNPLQPTTRSAVLTTPPRNQRPTLSSRSGEGPSRKMAVSNEFGAEGSESDDDQLPKAGNLPMVTAHQALLGRHVLPAALPAGLPPVPFSAYMGANGLPGLGYGMGFNMPMTAGMASGAAGAMAFGPMQHIAQSFNLMPQPRFFPAGQQPVLPLQLVTGAGFVSTAVFTQQLPLPLPQVVMAPLYAAPEVTKQDDLQTDSAAGRSTTASTQQLSVQSNSGGELSNSMAASGVSNTEETGGDNSTESTEGDDGVSLDPIQALINADQQLSQEDAVHSYSAADEESSNRNALVANNNYVNPGHAPMLPELQTVVHNLQEADTVEDQAEYCLQILMGMHAEAPAALQSAMQRLPHDH